MFDHLLDPQFTDIEEASVPQLLGAQASTAQWLEELGGSVDVMPEDDAQKLAREAFRQVTMPGADVLDAKAAILAMRAPAAVRHHAEMLSEYDWAFVEQAKEIRGYIVSKLMDLTKSPDPKVQLAAIKQLGSVTEVGAFTERIEVTKRDAGTDEVVSRLRAKLEKLLPKTGAEDATIVAEPKDFTA